MINNHVLRSIRDIFDFNDEKMIAVFGLADHQVTEDQVSGWLKKSNDPDYQGCSDTKLAIFLNGFINDQRGKKEGPGPKPEKWLTNNIILRKLIIALNLKSEETLHIMELGDSEIKKYELIAFFRKVDHKQYRECKDKVLRNFLKGVQLKHRDNI